MPEVLPPRLIFQQFKKKVAFILMTISRAILVICIWLILLPYFTVWIWRFYFYLGNHVSKRLLQLQDMKNKWSYASASNMTSIFFNTSIVHDNNTTINWIDGYKSGLTLQ
ncbi:uncharacterized protein EV154DRAFT_296353 [Mucor mucedo]|uniref:uncharacterized protein n=1 Tax=Mucor mucedo TaxID=29922 RepID=UPI00221FA3C6|nr:uncharacterized protein EV154DRAFT_296353 [Mucor mucedo]KAI7895815.1 hypothetical protein EV154DRAFT_296353 [Mucor mucedo]